MKFIIPIAVLLFFTACEQNESSSAAAANTTSTPTTEKGAAATDDFIFENIAGTDTKRAHKKDKKGNITVEGFMLNGKKVGMWSTFEKEFIFPKTMTSYQNGKKNGPHYEYTERGTVILKENYINDVLDGYWAKFKFSKPKEQGTYKNGKLNGAFREYDVRKNFLFKETMYVNGEVHGTIKFMDESGRVTMQYEYENGEKVSGGIVE